MITPRAFAVLFALLITPGLALAQCEFNAVAKAKGMKSSLLRAFQPCPSTPLSVENSSTQGGVAACSPVNLNNLSTYNFTGNASCSVGIKARIEKDCAALDDGVAEGPCSALTVKGKCSGILQPSNGEPIGVGDGVWSLILLVRASLNDSLSGDVTLVDLPIVFESAPEKGSLNFRGNSVQALSEGYNEELAALPTCTQLEILSVTINDGTDTRFATLGVGSATKAEAGPGS